ncbi:hypothetical protein FB446DRAFT_727127 [Lentinula raphanica]|nr:hypothetical protein FB446DRAFT_727127 [Lentinula raphanica]
MPSMISRLHPQLRAMSDDTGATTPNSTGGETRTFAQSGSLGHRLIGVLIVLSLLVLAFVLWLLLAKRPRRKLRGWGCTCLPAPPERTAEGEEKYAENRNGDDHNVNRPESWVISHDMEAYRMSGVGQERSSLHPKHILAEDATKGEDVKKVCPLKLVIEMLIKLTIIHFLLYLGQALYSHNNRLC